MQKRTALLKTVGSLPVPVAMDRLPVLKDNRAKCPPSLVHVGANRPAQHVERAGSSLYMLRHNCRLPQACLS